MTLIITISRSNILKFNQQKSLFFECFSVLAFLPTKDVEKAYEELIDNKKIPSEFIAYFDLTYMGVVRGRGARQRRDPPIFPLAIWNISERFLQDLPRTNNAAEGFHSAIKHSTVGAQLNIEIYKDTEERRIYSR